MTRPADYAVVATTIAAGLVVLGMMLGEHRAITSLVTDCRPRQGEVLVAAVQELNPARITCVYQDAPRHKPSRRSVAA